MIRVHFEDREPIDVDTNHIEFTAAGGVVLQHVEVRAQPNPQNLKEMRMVVSNPQLIWAFSRDAHWTKVENLDLGAEEELTVRPLEALTR